MTTSEIVNISGHSATSGGIIISKGTDFVIEKGVCWSKVTTPGITDSKTSDGDGSDSFISNIPDLTAATTYFVRAYATSSIGTGYGTEVTFTTLGQIPTASSEEATNITATSAILNSTVNANYLSTVVLFEYGVDTNYGNTIIATQSPVTGDSITHVSSDITGLVARTIYHFRVKTMNELGVNYGRDLTFKTFGQIPAATTQPATNVSMEYADLNAIINANYIDTKVTFEYGPTSEYGLSVSPVETTVTGNTNTTVITHLTGLPAGTLFHFRVKATNELGTTYGNDLTFTTLGQPPIAITKSASGVSTTSVYLFGTAKPNYLATDLTFEYGTNTSYGNTIVAMKSPVNGDTITHLVSAIINGLEPETQYHFRITASNELGTSYGDDMTFVTTPAVMDIDGNVYNTVRIGSQLWMAENLKTIKYNNGTIIPLVTLDSEWWGASNSPGFCWPNNDEARYKATYGAYYNWYSINTSNLCPTGWHVPSDAEWSVLRTTFGGFSEIVVRVAEPGNPHYHFEYWILANESGFKALPGGLRDSGFQLLGNFGYWWSSTEGNSLSALSFEITYGVQHVNRNKRYGFSVRCLKD